MRIQTIQPQYSDFIPDKLKEGVLYISERYKTASHKCACGCGEEVVTPLSPVEWQLQKAGGKVSLHPSIGNWNYACKSHYWIRNNSIQWAGSMNSKQIAHVQSMDRVEKQRFVAEQNLRKGVAQQDGNGELRSNQRQSWIGSVLSALVLWLKGK